MSVLDLKIGIYTEILTLIDEGKDVDYIRKELKEKIATNEYIKSYK